MKGRQGEIVERTHEGAKALHRCVTYVLGGAGDLSNIFDLI